MSRLRWWRRRDETPVAELQRSNPVRLGVVVLVLALIGGYFAYTKHIPYTHGYRLKAVFPSSLNISPRAPVRIAGVDVGQVESVSRAGPYGLVTMEIEKDGLPIHRDATLKIRPRIFLEGNFFVELQPGSPSAPTVSSGYTVPITQTADPVQIDQLLDALNSDTRSNLQIFLAEFGAALTRKPTPAEDAEQDPEVRGLNAAQALNKAATHSIGATRDIAIVNQALGGTETHDLSALIAAGERTTAALNVHEQQLGELFGNLNTFFSSLAAQSPSLRRAVAELPAALHSTISGFKAFNAANGPTRRIALELIPGVQQAGPTTAAALPWIAQARQLFGPNELGGVAHSLNSAAPAIAGLLTPLPSFFHEAELLGRCLTKVFYPTGEARIQDGANTSGMTVEQEALSGFVGFNAAGQGFDSNGNFERLMITGGNQIVTVPSTTLPDTSVKGNSLAASTGLTPLGTSPRVPAVEPPYKPLVACYTQAPPNLNGPLASGPADGSGG